MTDYHSPILNKKGKDFILIVINNGNSQSKNESSRNNSVTKSMRTMEIQEKSILSQKQFLPKIRGSQSRNSKSRYKTDLKPKFSIKLNKSMKPSKSQMLMSKGSGRALPGLTGSNNTSLMQYLSRANHSKDNNLLKINSYQSSFRMHPETSQGRYRNTLEHILKKTRKSNDSSPVKPSMADQDIYNDYFTNQPINLTITPEQLKLKKVKVDDETQVRDSVDSFSQVMVEEILDLNNFDNQTLSASQNNSMKELISPGLRNMAPKINIQQKQLNLRPPQPVIKKPNTTIAAAEPKRKIINTYFKHNAPIKTYSRASLRNQIIQTIN